MIIDIPGVTERRQTPRYEIELSIDMVLETGNILTVTSRNISSSGLQIICDCWVTDEIEPRGIQNHAISHIRFKAITELPVGDQTKKLYATCRIMSVQRLSQEEYMLNLAFIDFENGSEKALDEFLDQFEQKKTIKKPMINSFA
jgi:c-di-GMP-binding flagellar brake protein YcgR